MSQSRLRLMLIISPIMMLSGWVIIFAMVIEALQSTFILNFGSYALIFAGFVMGMLGVLLSRGRREKEKQLGDFNGDIEREVEEVPKHYTPFQRKMKSVEKEIKEDLKEKFQEEQESSRKDEE